MKKKRLRILGLTLCFLCFAGACTTGDADGGTTSGDLAGTHSPLPGNDYLDKGGANPTDNISIVNPDVTLPSETLLPDTDDGAISDLGEDLKSGAEDLIHDASDAFDDVDSLSGTTGHSAGTNAR